MSPIVSVQDIHKSYGPLEVLKGVSLDVTAGQMVAIIGRSGSGKSTLLRCLNGLERVDSGKIVVCGTVLTEIDGRALRELRTRVGIVFQGYNLFPHLTVRRNITLALTDIRKMNREQANGIAERVLEQVGMSNKIDAYPEQLSGGQQQRVAIARSLAMEPELILFDEVTSALDPELTGEVLKVMESLAADGMTMVLVTHEMGFARKAADVIVYMHEGRIWEQSAPVEFFGDPKTPELRKFLSSEL